MTGRKRFVLDKAWLALRDLNEKHGRMVTAGEFARELGISRNTAQNWLIEMACEEAIHTLTYKHGNVTVSRFGIYGFTFDGRE